MPRGISILFVPFVFCSFFSGCAPTRVETRAKMKLDRLFANNFEGLDVPVIAEIRKEGTSKRFPYVTFDQVWESAIIVLMQRGIIVRSSKDTGVIISPPLTVFVERGEVVTLFVYWMNSLYGRVDKPEKAAVEFEPELKEEMINNCVGKIATELYAGQKWRYLEP